MADEADNNVDETAGFEVASSDLPTEQPETPESNEPASSEVPDSGSEEGKEESKESEEPNDESKGDELSNDDNTSDDSTANSGKGKGVQKRINKVVREREDAKRENERLKREISELKGNSKGDEVEHDLTEPKESDFETYGEYIDALDEYESKIDETPAVDKAPKKDESADSSGLTESQKTAMAVIKESVEGAAKPDDFETVALDPEVPITGDMLEAIAECEDPSAVLYHLGKNRDEAKKIAGGSTVQQMRAIAKLELNIESKPIPPKPKQLTEAPNPITPVTPSDAQKKSASEMSFSEYEKERNLKERKGRSEWN